MDNFQERIILQKFFVDVFHNENFNKLLEIGLSRFIDVKISRFNYLKFYFSNDIQFDYFMFFFSFFLFVVLIKTHFAYLITERRFFFSIQETHTNVWPIVQRHKVEWTNG